MGEYRYKGDSEKGIGRLRFSEPVSEERVEDGRHACYVSNVRQEILQIFESSACSGSVDDLRNPSPALPCHIRRSPNL